MRRTLTSPWGNEDTQQLIDTLKKYNVNATFFVVGAWVDKYPESVKALSDAGNEVMSHSNDHAHFNSLTSEEITANVTAGNDKIEKVTGKKPTLFRCPYGEYDNHVITTVKGMGITPIQWNVEPLHPFGVMEWWHTICLKSLDKSALIQLKDKDAIIKLVFFHL